MRAPAQRFANFATVSIRRVLGTWIAHRCSLSRRHEIPEEHAMTRFTYTGCLFAVAIAASGAAFGQQACQQDIQQLERQLQQRQLDQSTTRQVQELIDSARSASDQ